MAVYLVYQACLVACSIVVCIVGHQVLAKLKEGQNHILNRSFDSKLPHIPCMSWRYCDIYCSSTNGLLYWALEVSQGTGSTGYTTASPHNYTILVLNFIYVLSDQNLTSTATVHNVTNSLTGTTIYCSVDAVNYDEMATVSVRG